MILTLRRSRSVSSNSQISNLKCVLREPANPDLRGFECQRDGQVRSSSRASLTPSCCNCSLRDNLATAYHLLEPQTGLFASTYLFMR
ncbi:hypothetical protein [Tychonema sp. LEGE 07203]|uniref:hypothetical protein n=1 Tax=Tychonema sp. LEGE 07203 TaxID=1828671 RepID=UPI00187E4AAE|nr:hypothetical protein [Tychonema sp. LEGE 07203]MBE9095895.1 hypothetical protein [Tychonema sp. LEGE 07203]